MPALDKKYRPKTFKTFYGNQEVVNSLQAHLDNMDTFPGSILFKGPSGCGKTTLARILAKKMKIKEIYELNVADSRKIDDARDILANLRYAPITGRGKVIILNECHEAIKQFQDALLERIEEPPPNTYFILCTTDPQKLLEAIKTRVTPYLVSTLNQETITKLIKKVCRREKIKLHERMVKRVAQASEGVPRSALVLLNSIKDVKKTVDQNKLIEGYLFDESPQINKLCQYLLRGATYKEIMGVAKEIDEDPERVRRAMMAYMSKVLMGGPSRKAALIMDNLWESWYWVGRPGLIISLYHILEGE